MSDDKSKGERIAKAMARAGVASRRDAEKMILEGRVSVNGQKVVSPALDVTPTDKVMLDGKPIDAPQPARLWLYYKPVGLVTSAKDEKGRQTVFDTMPEGMPRVMSVGRLDLNSEGLLLLTNDGELKRQLELPSTGWLRKYRVRVNGRPNDATFDPLRRGVAIEGEEFQPMEITLDKQQGANAWLTVGLREGKNREIRRAMTEVGLIVNRLIRVSYGPFRLNKMKPGDVVEVKAKVMREQLGGLIGEEPAEEKRKPRDGDAPRDRKPRTPRGGDAKGPHKPRAPRRDEDGGAKSPRWTKRPDRDGDTGPARQRDDRPKSGKPRFPRDEDKGASGERRFSKPRHDGERTERDGDRKLGKPRAKTEGSGQDGARRFGKPRTEGEQTERKYSKPRAENARGERKFQKPRDEGGRGDDAPDRKFAKPRTGAAQAERGGERKFSKPRDGGPAGAKGGKPAPRRDNSQGRDRPKTGGPRKGPQGRK
ncbi:pseudouridine synthase [Defluviimonas sp. WL0050]|uniref:Pseudouridine synthase n=1 Tax=Albidovulum litorale TaxID=2984134 RepID=A0ABT2ZJK0_9RHOB|nr:pseudouridine synthase [Defluviimonas sp. WL0050]MCV2871295.1 pseudouridine synthase [Defluviimonas sp. WL0050]